MFNIIKSKKSDDLGKNNDMGTKTIPKTSPKSDVDSTYYLTYLLSTPLWYGVPPEHTNLLF